jgi:hypothetical protein
MIQINPATEANKYTVLNITMPGIYLFSLELYSSDPEITPGGVYFELIKSTFDNYFDSLKDQKFDPKKSTIVSEIALLIKSFIQRANIDDLEDDYAMN